MTLDANSCLWSVLFALIWEIVLLSAEVLKWWCPLNPSLQLWHAEVQDESLVTVSEGMNAQANAIEVLSSSHVAYLGCSLATHSHL